MGSSTKKLKVSEYSCFETIRFLFEEFFNIIKNKRDIIYLRKKINIEVP